MTVNRFADNSYFDWISKRFQGLDKSINEIRNRLFVPTLPKYNPLQWPEEAVYGQLARDVNDYDTLWVYAEDDEWHEIGAQLSSAYAVGLHDYDFHNEIRQIQRGALQIAGKCFRQSADNNIIFEIIKPGTYKIWARAANTELPFSDGSGTPMGEEFRSQESKFWAANRGLRLANPSGSLDYFPLLNEHRGLRKVDHYSSTVGTGTNYHDPVRVIGAIDHIDIEIVPTTWDFPGNTGPSEGSYGIHMTYMYVVGTNTASKTSPQQFSAFFGDEFESDFSYSNTWVFTFYAERIAGVMA
jgi:hypothetical protein